MFNTKKHSCLKIHRPNGLYTTTPNFNPLIDGMGMTIGYTVIKGERVY